MTWQDISTAPKDGTHIIGYGVMPPRRGGFTNRTEAVPFLDTVYWLGGFWQAGRYDGTPELTHWQSLPESPQ